MIKRYVFRNKGYLYEVELGVDPAGNVTLVQPGQVEGNFIFLYPTQARRVVRDLQKEFDRRDKRDARAK